MSAPAPTSTPQSKTTAILGAGITGLQTALSILSSSPSPSPSLSSSPPPYSTHSHPKILIIAQHVPGDESIDYTSPWAGGHWRSHAHSTPEDAELQEWDQRTYQEWRRLLARTVDDVTGPGGGEGKRDAAGQALLERELGLGIRESIMFWSENTDETLGGPAGTGEGLWWRDVVSGFRVLSAHELALASRASGDAAEDAVVFGARYDTVCINVPRYLEYLRERVAALGGEFVRATIRTEEGVEGVVRHVQQIAAWHTSQSHAAPPSPGPSDAELETVILATGLLSRSFLPADEAAKLYPVRGQTVLVKGEAPRAVTHLFPGGEIAYVIPRPGSGTTILGGCKEPGNWDEEEDTGLTERILRRARGLVPELLTGDGDGFEVLGVQVGRRPGRKGGPRVEVETETVRGVRVVHAYGHEGAGYQNSVGSAEKVVRLLAEGLYEETDQTKLK